MLKGNHFLLIICLLGFLFVSCKKNANSKKQQPCPGGCGVIDFSLIDYEPAWSPDGKYIAYYHSDKEISKNGTYLITPDGSENRLWHRGAGATPTWSPDGQWVAFSEGAQIWKKKLNGDSLTRITKEGRNFFPSWSPDGKWIAYDSNTESPNGMNFIWKVSVITNTKTRIVYEPLKGEIRMPYWRGGEIYHTRYLVGVTSTEIFSMNEDGSEPMRLTNNSATDNYPRYSVVDKKISFTSQPQNGYPQIWIMNADGSNQQQLTQTGGFTSDWSPDGKSIVYTDSRSVNGRLWIMNADGSGKHQLTFKENF